MLFKIISHVINRKMISELMRQSCGRMIAGDSKINDQIVTYPAAVVNSNQ
jgi:hypothetical protein